MLSELVRIFEGTRTRKEHMKLIAKLAVAACMVFGLTACPPQAPSNQAPLAVFSASVNTGPNPLIVTFDATNSADPDGTVVAWNWNFGDYTTGSGVTVTHTFPAGGFTVTLTVTDNAGASRSSTTVITSQGAPTGYPQNLQKVAGGCCDTYGDFAWDAVPGAQSYEIYMGSYFGGGCLTDHSAIIPAPAVSGRVQAFGLCLGSHYNTKIRYQANGLWGPWSPTINIVL